MSTSLQQISPYLIRKFFRALTLFGSTFFYLFILVFLFRTHTNLAIQAFFALATVEISTAILKIIYPKNRPAHNGRRHTLLDKYEAGSFPSIHSARAAVLAHLSYQLFGPDPIIFPFSLLTALIIAYSRIYLKRHYLIDVMAGLGLGFIISTIFFGN